MVIDALYIIDISILRGNSTSSPSTLTSWYLVKCCTTEWRSLVSHIISYFFFYKHIINWISVTYYVFYMIKFYIIMPKTLSLGQKSWHVCYVSKCSRHISLRVFLSFLFCVWKDNMDNECRIKKDVTEVFFLSLELKKKKKKIMLLFLKLNLC